MLSFDGLRMLPVALSPVQDDFDGVGLVAPHEFHPFGVAGRRQAMGHQDASGNRPSVASRTWPAPGCGRGRSCHANWPGPVLTIAFIAFIVLAGLAVLTG